MCGLLGPSEVREATVLLPESLGDMIAPDPALTLLWEVKELHDSLSLLTMMREASGGLAAEWPSSLP